MKDSAGKEIVKGQVVVINNAYSKLDNGRYVVDSIYHDDSMWLKRLNKDNTLSKSGGKSWPIRSYSNDRFKRCAINAHNSQFATIHAFEMWVEPEPKPVDNSIKILKNGIRQGEYYVSCFYGLNKDTQAVTVYARNYSHLPYGLGDIKNDSDSMTDYFESDSCTIHKGEPYYEEVLSAYKRNHPNE